MTQLDKLDTPQRLQDIARCIREFGSDMTAWSKPTRIAEYLEEHSARIFASRAWAEQDKLRTTWQPIETAPRDGTAIIGYGKRNICCCWWQDEFDGFIMGCHEMVMADGYTIDGKGSRLHSPEMQYPSHWMPLPSPPKTEEKL
tara:strand:+ start:3550 stop:3978 length:429 start_codon:yes stop_codon:yes gene_type:complete